MTVSSTSSTTENYYVSSTDEDDDDSSSSELTDNDFLLLLIEELQNQDPLEPLDTGEMMSQICELETVQNVIAQTEAMEDLADTVSGITDTLDEISDSLGSSSTESEFQAASSLIGYYVTGTDSDGDTVEGTVYSVTLSDDGVTVTLDDDTEIAYEDITDVTIEGLQQ